MTNKLKTQNPKLHTSAHHTQTHTWLILGGALGKSERGWRPGEVP